LSNTIFKPTHIQVADTAKQNRKNSISSWPSHLKRTFVIILHFPFLNFHKKIKTKKVSLLSNSETELRYNIIRNIQFKIFFVSRSPYAKRNTMSVPPKTKNEHPTTPHVSYYKTITHSISLIPHLNVKHSDRTTESSSMQTFS
jgi:hypothetical protein